MVNCDKLLQYWQIIIIIIIIIMIIIKMIIIIIIIIIIINNDIQMFVVQKVSFENMKSF